MGDNFRTAVPRGQRQSRKRPCSILCPERRFDTFLLDIAVSIWYNSTVMGYGVTVTHRTLTPVLLVRVQLSQPVGSADSRKSGVATADFFLYPTTVKSVMNHSDRSAVCTNCPFLIPTAFKVNDIKPFQFLGIYWQKTVERT